MARLTLILSTITAVIALLGGFRYVVDTLRDYRGRKRQTGKWLTVLAICLLPDISMAVCTVTTADLQQSTVQTAINNATAGDTICIPAGSQTWTTATAFTPSVTINKAVTLQGTTSCTGSPVTCVDGTVINDGTGSGSSEVVLFMNTANARVTGISFKDPRALSDAKGVVDIRCGSCRFDHNSLTQTNSVSAPHGIMAYWPTSGSILIDHNYIRDHNASVDVFGARSGSDGTYPGDLSWETALTLGSDNAVYIEDNNFDHTVRLDGAYDAYSGARVVFRYNTVSKTSIGSHGLDSGGLRSALSQEVLRNTFTNSGGAYDVWWSTRGGTALILANTINPTGGSYNAHMRISNFRSNDVSCGVCGSWTLCNGTTVYDQNTTGQQGYICRDQAGRGPETDSVNDWPVNTVTPTFSEALYPIYSSGNDFKGAAPSISNVGIGSSDGTLTNVTRVQTYHILNNRDFYVEVPSFDGTTGTGSGTLAARPATCTAGVAYWATDQGSWNQAGGSQGVLYKCTSTNTWTLYYTPYTYPHPLQGASGGGSAPILFISSVWGAVTLAAQVLTVCGVVWEYRRYLTRAAVMGWQYVTTLYSPKELLWIYRYKRAVAQWQKEAPRMLDAPMVVLDVPAEKTHEAPNEAR